MKNFLSLFYPAVVCLMFFLLSKLISFEGVVIIIGVNLLLLVIEIKDKLENLK